MKVVGYCVLAMLISVLAWTPPAEASWSHDTNENNLLCWSYGDQNDIQVASDGTGGFIAVWVDGRGVDANIYAQHVSATGVANWTPGGVIVCTASGVQDSPRVISDGAGGAIAVWRDVRGAADANVYAQRIDPSGASEWTYGGIVVCSASGDQDCPVLVSDGSGGAFIAWEDHRSDATYEDAFAQRIDSNGDAQWAPGGIALSDSTEAQRSIEVAGDGSGGAVFVWSDERASVGGIMAARLNASGGTVWPSSVSLVGAGATSWDNPAVLSDGWGGVFIACEGLMGSGELDILGQRVDASGVPLWGSGGAALCIAGGDQSAVRLVPDDAGGVILAWSDGRSGLHNDVYALRVNGWGTSQWPLYPLGLPVSNMLDDTGAPSLAADGAGGAVVAWHGGQANYEDIYAQRIGADGTVVWTLGGKIVSSAFGQKLDPQVASDGAGGGVMAWSDHRDAVSGFDVYAQRIERNGYLGYPAPEITTVRDHPDDQGGEMVASWLPSYLDVWPNDDVGYYSVWRRYAGMTRGAPPRQSFPWYLDPRDPEALARDGWAYAGQIQSCQLEEYSFVVPTFGDSSASGIVWTDVMVLAHSYFPDDCWVSETATGYSVDNWAPGPPDLLKAVAAGADVQLMWSPSRYRDEDLSHYDVHRSDVAGFAPDPATLIASPADTVFTDAGPGEGTWYYRVVGEDVHGNEGDPSNEASATLGTGVDDAGIATVLTIRGNAPNPFNPTTRIEYDLPKSGRVRLDVFSAAGDLVVTVEDGFREAGRRQVVWNGTDAAGNALPSGVYFARLAAGEERAVHTMVLLK